MIQSKHLRNKDIVFEKPKPFENKMVRTKDLKTNDTWEFFRRLGYIDSNTLYPNQNKHFINAWENEPCFIIGAGPALKEFIKEVGWDFLNNKHTIGINHVIEDYDLFEWFFFLDKRFLNKTTYNMENYTGTVFAQSNTGLKPSENTVIFTCNGRQPELDFNKGLYSANFSGLAALNLALISGANPIYLLGYGNGKDANKTNYHYKKDYTGEVKTEKVFNKFTKVMRGYNKFKRFEDRIIHVTEGNDIPVFKKIRMAEFKKQIPKLEITQIPNIAHISFTDDIDRHADITRHVISDCFGNHKLYKQDLSNIPKADIYILEHFQSTDNYVKRFPFKNKAIDIVHTVNCIPDKSFKKIVVLTDAWRRVLKSYFINDVEIINIGLDQEQYKNILPDYDKKIFGRITRWSPGKVHPAWNAITKEILEAITDASCLIYTQADNTNRRMFKHERMIYSNECKINMFKGDFLKKMSIYVHANGTFIDTFSHGVLEAMSTGLPVILLKDKVGAVEEVAGDAGIVCETIDDVKIKIIELLNNKDKRIEHGCKSKLRAGAFTKDRMVRRFNEVIKKCLR